MMKLGIFISEDEMLWLWSQLRRWFKARSIVFNDKFSKSKFKDLQTRTWVDDGKNKWVDDGKNKNKFNPRWKTVTKSNTSSFKPITKRSSSVYRRRLRK